MMDKYFYTLELCDVCGELLERLADHASYDDVEAFAAMVLCHGLRVLEEDFRRSEQLATERARNPNYDPYDGLDDEIPF
ncbi:MAG: hypothetical protein ACK4GM_05095 [Tabrizicola sp.]